MRAVQFALLGTGLILLNGCGLFSSGAHPAQQVSHGGEQKATAEVTRAVGTIGNNGNALQSTTGSPQALLAAHRQYAMLCQQKLDEINTSPQVAHVLSQLPHLCDCVADKLQEGVAIAKAQGNDAAKKHVNDAMMDCVPGARQAKEQMAGGQDTTEPSAGLPSAGDAAGLGSLVSPDESQDKTPTPQRPRHQGKLRYDPKTKTWVN